MDFIVRLPDMEVRDSIYVVLDAPFSRFFVEEARSRNDILFSGSKIQLTVCFESYRERLSRLNVQTTVVVFWSAKSLPYCLSIFGSPLTLFRPLYGYCIHLNDRRIRLADLLQESVLDIKIP